MGHHTHIQRPHNVLGEYDQTIDSLAHLLATVRTLEAQHTTETARLHDELTSMRQREATLAAALARLRDALAADADAMFGTEISGDLEDLQTGAANLRAESDERRRRAEAAELARARSEQMVKSMRDEIAQLQAELQGAVADREAMRERLEEHERRLAEAGLEIEWRPLRRGRSR